MSNGVSCDGELLLFTAQSIWRPKKWSTGSTRCRISLVYKQNRYHLEASETSSQDPENPGMFFPLDQVKEYAILEASRHQVLLQDGRHFTLLLDVSEDTEVFKNEIRKALKVSGKSRQSMLLEAEPNVLMGPPIGDGELRREAFRRSRSKEATLDYTDGCIDMRHRPLPPIPRIKDEDDEEGEIYEDIDDIIADDNRHDEETLLQDAIMLGDIEGAAKLAMSLARKRRVLFISTGVDLDDIVKYLPREKTREDIAPMPSIPGYLTMIQVKELTKDTLAPPVPPRRRSRSPSPSPRKKIKTPDANRHLSNVPPLRVDRNHNAFKEIWM
ncbi:hypothetical protein CAPTEDRAFT_185478 [Capitella teleta]|uniref:Uncharacterized protein n=1 Tax=Capitella teleta TaxID=283909 RepID=R7VJH3_CAPTE|nr:hypothetical protein CAPTEDRAFT_185478 [Capitella teleta]|eukprot:ELU16516.1 hypothetical protein CAPTEDRAFT_185478 [Capitella teleta]